MNTSHGSTKLITLLDQPMVLRKFVRFTPMTMKVRKTLAEALILSKINYCNVVYGQLPEYLIFNDLDFNEYKAQLQVTYMDGMPKCLM